MQNKYHAILVFLTMISMSVFGTDANNLLTEPDLRPGEKIVGDRFETWIDLEFDTRDRAELWLNLNPEEAEAEILPLEEDRGGAIIRVPRTVDDLPLYTGVKRRIALSSKYVQSGVMYGSYLSQSFETRDAAEAIIKSGNAKLGKFGVPWADRGFAVGYYTGEIIKHRSSYFARAKFAVDLTKAARFHLDREKRILLHLPGRPTEDIKMVGEGMAEDGTAVVLMRMTGSREVLGRAAECSAGYRRTDAPGKTEAELAKARPAYSLRVKIFEAPISEAGKHFLLGQLVCSGIGEPFIVTIDGMSVACRAIDADGKMQFKGVWQVSDHEAAFFFVDTGERFTVEKGIESIRPFLKGMLAWLPSIWPHKDTQITVQGWAEDEVRDILRRMEFLEPMQSREWYVDQNGQKKQEDLYSELWHLEEWYDTPLPLPPMDQNATMEERSEACRIIREWWNNPKIEKTLRPNAPVPARQLILEKLRSD